MKILISVFVAMIFLSPLAFSNSELLSCQWGGTYQPNEFLFFANDDYSNIVGPSSGQVLSSPISFSNVKTYDNPLSCTSPLNEPGDELSFYESNDPTCAGDEVISHFTSSTNGLAAFEYDASKHSSTLCAELPTSISSVDIVVSDDPKYETIGYQCLFRISGNESGRVSSCDATFNSGNTYQYTVWARAFQSLSSLSCNSDCSSQLDNRIRVACSQKVDSCQNVPGVCDGSLVGSWVDYNATHQVKCSLPWNEFRLDPSEAGSTLDVMTTEERCPNVITQDYSIILDNEPVVMKVFVCSD